MSLPDPGSMILTHGNRRRLERRRQFHRPRYYTWAIVLYVTVMVGFTILAFYLEATSK